MTPLVSIPAVALSLDSIARALVASATLAAGFIAVVRERGSRASVAFFALACAIAAWLGGQAASFSAPDPETALWWTRKLTVLGMVFIPSLLVLFVARTTGTYRRLKSILWPSLALSTAFYAVFSLTDWFIPSVRPVPWGWTPQYSPLTVTFAVFLAASLAVCFVALARRIGAMVTLNDRRRSRLILVALGLSCLGIIDFLPVYGLPVYPAGYVGIAGLVVVAARILSRYRLTVIAPDSAGQEIIRTTADGIVALDLEGFIRFANDAASRLFGSPISRSIGESASDIPALAAITQRLPQVLEQGSGTFEAVVPGREESTASFSASVIYDSEHRPAMVVFIARDLTQHVKDEAALRYERNLLRTLIDNLPVGVYVKDASRRKLITNPIDLEWMRQWLPEGEVLGKTDEEIFSPALAASFTEDDRKVIETGTAVIEHEEFLRRPDGSGQWNLTTKLPLFDAGGRVVGLLGMGRDITERRRQAQERDRLFAEAVQERDRAEAHAAQLDAVFSSMTEGVILYGPDGAILRANEVAAKLLAARSAPSDRRFLSEDGEPVAQDDVPLRRALRGETVLDMVLGVPMPARGETQWLSVNAAPLRDQKGQLAGAVETFHDVTERKKAQKALSESEEQLRQSQKMEAIGRLAGGVAHDFNNLLTVINGYSDIVLAGMAGEDPHRVAMAQIQRSGERAASLTGKLLAFGRKQVLQPQVVDLNRLLDGLEKLLKRLIGEDIELVFALDSSPLTARIDPGQFEQVIINLAVNARDAMPEGGRLSIATHHRTLDEDFTQQHRDVKAGAYAEVLVTDSGEGMDAATRARIFEPFFTTKQPGRGTGLGLAMVYGFVKQSDGHVEVHSELGRGTTFRVYLPFVVEEPAPVRRPLEAMEIPRGTETILLIEDEDSVRSLVRLMLQAKGYTVLEAGDGEEALTVARQHPDPIHLLVTDLVMPRMGGRQVAEVLSRSHPTMRVLFISGYTDEEDMRRGVPGASFLQKPFNPAALARKVREVMDAPPAPATS